MADLIENITAQAYLGEEFLLWLWYVTLENENLVKTGGQTFDLHFDDYVILSGFLTETESTKLSGGDPAGSTETLLAVRSGKRITEARLSLTRDERQWKFTIKTDPFAFSAVRVPSVLSKREDERILERLFLIEELESCVFSLFFDFISERLFGDWQDTIDGIRRLVSV